MSVTGAEHSPEGQPPRQYPPSLAEQLRDLDPPPYGDGSYYTQEGVFDSDEELEEFVTSVHEARRAGTA